jgi:GPH family glycoside/pentoside/hexuronide:cation symporter
MPPIPDKITLREKLCYGCGDFASVLYWQTFTVFLPIFYTDVFGISAAGAGAVILFSRLLDGAVDPVMGMVADRTKTRWGKFRPYLLWICVPFAIVGVLTFTTPNLDGTGKLIWAFVTYNVLLMLYTAINIPYSALLGVLTSDSVERTSFSSIKFIGAYAAGTIVSATLLPMTGALGHGNAAHGWQRSFIVYGTVAVIFFLITFWGTRERIQPPKEQKTSVRRDLTDLFTNGPWIILLFTTFTTVLCTTIRGSMIVHYFKYYVGQQTLALPFTSGARTYGFEFIVSAFTVTGSVSSIIGVLLLAWFVKLVGKKPAFIILFSVSVVSTALLYFLRPDQLPAMFVLQVAGASTGGPVAALVWAMFADTADYGEWKHGRRATGLVFSATSLGMKIGFAIGAAAALWLLSIIGYQANVAQTPEVRHGLVLLVSLIPAVIGVVAITLATFYPLNETRTKEIGIALKGRRATEGAAPRAVR